MEVWAAFYGSLELNIYALNLRATFDSLYSVTSLFYGVRGYTGVYQNHTEKFPFQDSSSYHKSEVYRDVLQSFLRGVLDAD